MRGDVPIASRADKHAAVGRALHEACDNEWAAVCWFYAAYHRVTGAIRSDPIFDDITKLQAVHPQLLPDDRNTTRHKGRRRGVQGREWGVNELVLVLYGQAVAAAYDKLHRASVEVRYEGGLKTPLERVSQWLQVIQDAHAAGKLICPQ